jgi:hypothetical protein
MRGPSPLGALVDAFRGHASPLDVAHGITAEVVELCEVLDRLTALRIALNAIGPEGQQLVGELDRVTQLVRRAVHRGHPYNSRSVVDTLADLMHESRVDRPDAH